MPAERELTLEQPQAAASATNLGGWGFVGWRRGGKALTRRLFGGSEASAGWRSASLGKEERGGVTAGGFVAGGHAPRTRHAFPFPARWPVRPLRATRGMSESRDVKMGLGLLGPAHSSAYPARPITRGASLSLSPKPSASSPSRLPPPH
ncbi:hypothetical protein DAI22_03g167200 [Oryza sativa Japonica Group]|nr:hypothetical protein DAI22_03g167200 [Oryza sativa Japonica Group]